MSCPTVGVCFGCVLAGLQSCPFRCASTVKPSLPLVDHERPKVIYRGYLWATVDGQRILWSQLNDPTKW